MSRHLWISSYFSLSTLSVFFSQSNLLSNSNVCCCFPKNWHKKFKNTTTQSGVMKELCCGRGQGVEEGIREASTVSESNSAPKRSTLLTVCPYILGRSGVTWQNCTAGAAAC